MFDLISGEHRRVPHRDTAPLFLSIVTHVLLVGAVATVPLFYAATEMPEVPRMLAFVAMGVPTIAAATTAAARSCATEGHAEACSDERPRCTHRGGEGDRDGAW